MPKAIRDNKFKLWGIILLILGTLGTAYFGLYSGLTHYDKWTAKPFVEEPLVAGETTQPWPPPKEKSLKRILDNSSGDESELKKSLLELYSAEELAELSGIETRFYDESLFFTVLETEKDWFEELKVGKIENDKINWLDMKNPPTEMSILSAKFVEIKGLPYPVLEVFGKTHMGNGHMYLYTIKGHKLNLFFDTFAVDSHNENVWQPEGYPQYGYFSCGQVYSGDRLITKYSNLDKNGLTNLELTGKTEVLCEKIKNYEPFDSEIVKVDEIPVKFTFFIKP